MGRGGARSTHWAEILVRRFNLKSRREQTAWQTWVYIGRY